MLTPLSRIGLLHHGDGGPAGYYPDSETLVWGSGGMHVGADEVFEIGGGWCVIRSSAVTGDTDVDLVLARYHSLR
jgi:hypothetical protein